MIVVLKIPAGTEHLDGAKDGGFGEGKVGFGEARERQTRVKKNAKKSTPEEGLAAIMDGMGELSMGKKMDGAVEKNGNSSGIRTRLRRRG